MRDDKSGENYIAIVCKWARVQELQVGCNDGAFLCLTGNHGNNSIFLSANLASDGSWLVAPVLGSDQSAQHQPIWYASIGQSGRWHFVW